MTIKSLTAAAVVGTLGFVGATSSASGYDPSLDVVVTLGDFTVFADANGNPITVGFNLTGPADVVGFSFAGDASGVSGNGTWASDTRLSVQIGGVEQFNIGGLTGRDNDWDFQGGGSTDDGSYASGPHLFAKNNPVADGADWSFVFFHNWNSASAAPITWDNVNITLHRVPAPGAMALMGLGGLAVARRRR